MSDYRINPAGESFVLGAASSAQGPYKFRTGSSTLGVTISAVPDATTTTKYSVICMAPGMAYNSDVAIVKHLDNSCPSSIALTTTSTGSPLPSCDVYVTQGTGGIDTNFTITIEKIPSASRV